MFETLDVKKFEEWFDEWYKTAKQFKMSNKDIACAAFLSGWEAKEKELAALTARVKELEEALQKIANNPDCNISGSDYRIGVADGHRCQAEIARAALRGEV